MGCALFTNTSLVNSTGYIYTNTDLYYATKRFSWEFTRPLLNNSPMRYTGFILWANTPNMFLACFKRFSEKKTSYNGPESRKHTCFSPSLISPNRIFLPIARNTNGLLYIYIYIYIYTSWEYLPFGRVSQLELRRPNSGRPNSGRPNNGRPNIVVVVVVWSLIRMKEQV